MWEDETIWNYEAGKEVELRLRKFVYYFTDACIENTHITFMLSAYA